MIIPVPASRNSPKNLVGHGCKLVGKVDGSAIGFVLMSAGTSTDNTQIFKITQK